MRLWEVEHPYYCSNATYFHNCHFKHESATAFLEAFGDSDRDLNYVVRWDWKRKTDDDENILSNNGTFYVYSVTQRKGFLQSAEFPVTEADEPLLRDWLYQRWSKILANWSPISS